MKAFVEIDGSNTLVFSHCSGEVVRKEDLVIINRQPSMTGTGEPRVPIYISSEYFQLVYFEEEKL